MEYHQQQLQKHCRVCGKRLNKTKGKPQTVYSCTQHTSDLSTYAEVEIGNSEDDHIFPQQFCNSCHSKFSRAKQAAKDGVPFPSFTCMEWSIHQEESCKV